MSEEQSSPSGRDDKGRFIRGSKGGPGRGKGNRNKLGEEFIEALYTKFQEHGPKAIEAVALKDPATFLKIIGNILPREVVSMALNINGNVDLSKMEEAKGFVEAYRFARDRIGAAPITIDAELAHIDEGQLVTDAWKHLDDDD